MVKSILKSLSKLESLNNDSIKDLNYVQDLVLKATSIPSPAPNKILIDISDIEEIAQALSNLLSVSHQKSDLLSDLSFSSRSLPFISSSISILKKELNLLESSFKQSSEALNKNVNELLVIHKEYKTRVQSYFLDYLKGLDIDLRKILKPLVPTSVIKEQVKFPLINTNSSLRSSVQSINESVAADSQEETSVKSQPEPSEVTIQKLNAHIQMLVGTLENIAKDLIQVLTEADREYYQQLNNVEVYSRPPTPLAAPLPDYFCYELQDLPQEPYKPILTTDSKEIWLKRLQNLHNSRSIKDSLYKTLVAKLKKSTASKKLDLKVMFENTELSVTEREGLVYYLINGTTEFEKHVSLSDIMSESKLKPEPPKNPKPKSKPFHKLEKETDKRMSPINPDHEVAKISQGIFPQAKAVSSIRLGTRTPKIQRLFNNRKSVKVRSITPVEKEKMLQTKARTPSVQNNKAVFGTMNPKHRLRKKL